MAEGAEGFNRFGKEGVGDGCEVGGIEAGGDTVMFLITCDMPCYASK